MSNSVSSVKMLDGMCLAHDKQFPWGFLVGVCGVAACEGGCSTVVGCAGLSLGCA